MERMLLVIDTNVPLAANEASDAEPVCVLSCVSLLTELMNNGRLVLDDGWRIIKEYQNKLSPSGQPGLGDAFLKWVLTNQANPKRCTLVPLTLRCGDNNDFEEFPRDLALESFDRSDRKFVAASLSHESCPQIANATDTDYWIHRKALITAGVNVLFVCEDYVKIIAARKKRSTAATSSPR